MRGNGSRRWSARAAILFAVAASVVPVVFAGVLGTVALVLVGVGGVVVTVAALYWFLTRRGLFRWLGLGIAIGAPIVMLALFVRSRLFWVVLLSYALAALAVACARRALRQRRAEASMAEHDVPPPQRPFVVMNPYSGGGKVEKFDLKRKAEELGADVVLLEGPGTVDVTALSERAVEQGADLLGVAGGDGTQALVAAVAAEHHVPFLVISAGTRNHFAMDLGLDRADPSRSLDALRDGVELHVDLGFINGRPFVNNASFGVYAEIVRSPAYRDDKTATVLKMLPDLLTGNEGHRLVARIGDTTVEGPQAVLVSNNPYGSTDLAGLSRRDRLDRGVLGAVTVSVANTRQAVGLLRRTNIHGLTQNTAVEVTVAADATRIPVGVDGESLELATPVRCIVEPGVLRVRVPRSRPGVRPATPLFDWVGLWRLAFRPNALSDQARS
ncbi:NAD(+)/NADH kinase [Rhodococcus sp. BP-252]|uniref:diacylglycerol/lipid kinase family protein n=2 Tax=Rhodococcus TaxID=1827 RepID=UPI001C9BB7D3|nr:MULTISPECIES: diacylglycerol kinase family protein [unclassified Rhodococcus (in: high G+C Gram-positive bacteria)]MBY6410242.1 NAD(+)/NADH kinase [Rhodococcus sp. BP-320]MBY6415211.1 NAD(+)/NADH kinase [Rhodococcus sp. BP-321]MBY6421534.1 NAD(+)/NADH kinase [Rhodococcus sp. BP-324]MBY6425481.1 NAD(+)/NADH kinase [Rhodococcus sp. BP-323]MBY6430107.1 NAD(+)/NADH kinase [Rhodococcus sp. BP-322]